MTFVPAPEKGTKGGKEAGNGIARTDSAQDRAAGPREDRKEVGAPAQDAATIALVEELGDFDWLDEEDVAAGGIARQHTDTRLQTALPEERLFLSLLKIHTEAQTFIQEQGVNILFLALGFLHWYEAESSDKLRKAPLLLVPVELSRTGTRDVFRLRYSEDDLVQNLSLAAKLKTDFALDLPRYIAEANADASEMPGTDSFYEAVSGCVSKQPRWKVVPDEIHLGFFSFGKFLMFNDLDEAIWPENKRPSEHPVLGRLLGEGFSNETAFVTDDTRLDTIIEPGEVRFVRDADSSQTMAILEAREGRNLVIQGPPGTGKSQTITNIIAELLAGGKKVLFVAEKMAALEVVKRRLDECHLGDAVLELHSHKATKQSVIRELERTLQQGRPLAADGTDDLAALKAVRDELNAYCEAVNTAIGVSAVPFITALGHYLRTRRTHESLPAWSFEPMKAWSQRDQIRAREKVAELARHLRENGRPSLNTFYGTACRTFSPVEQARVTEELKHAVTLVSRMSESAGQLAAHLGLERPATLQDVDVICRTARRAAEAPPLIGVRLDSAVWQTGPESIRALVAAGRMMASARSAHDGMLIEQAWEQDLLTERQHLAQLGEKWWRVFSGAYRRARARLQGLCKKPLPKDNASTLALVDGILGYQLSKRTYDYHLALGEALFGTQWMGERSDWDVLGRSSEWVIGLHDDMGKGQLPAGIVGFLAGHPDAGSLGTSIGAIHVAASDLRARVTTIIDLLGFARSRPASTLLDAPFAELREQLSTWLEAVPAIYETIRFNDLRDELVALGLPDVAQAALGWERDADDLVHAFDYSWYAGLVAQVYGATPALARFDRVKQAHLIDRFRHLDQLSLGHAQAGLAKQIWETQPRLSDPGEMAIVRNEANKKRRLMPIRQLMDQAGRAVQAIKPVFMMSPMSIASFLPPGKVEFDVVIFDEASQVKAVDAFGALLRGRQAIVVGDTRQMPPTDFFGRDVEFDEEDNVTADIESVLSLFRARGAQERYLSWHYRSRHESLIAVSNVEFYERKLTIFSSSGTNALATGLEMVCLPHALYDRGRTRTNREEARAVAQAVMDHATTHPGLPLAVAALNAARRFFLARADRKQEQFLEVSGLLVEFVTGIRTLRLFNRAGAWWERLDRRFEAIRNSSMGVEAWAGGSVQLYRLCLELGLVALLLCGAWLAKGDGLAPLHWLLFAMVAYKLLDPLLDAAALLTELRAMARSEARVQALLDRPPLPDSPKPAEPDGFEVAFEGVGFRYDAGAEWVLRDVSFRAPQGRIVAVVGPSGGGKSTLLHLLARFFDPQEGRITLGGVDLRDLGPDRLYDHLGFVFQDVQLFDSSVLENVRIGRPNATDAEVMVACRAAWCDEFIRQLPQGYETPIGENGQRLSGGQRQRLSIARALLKDAPVLLLDEATASVDPEAQHEIQEAISRLIKGRTVIVIAHRLHTIQHADQILLLAQGRIIERGSHDELLRAGGLYRDMWALQTVTQ